jgi:hypothetical protein
MDNLPKHILVEMGFGSHLYGTSTPESDKDIKGVFMPELKDILLGKIPKQISCSVKNSDGIRNSSEDTDHEYYSLHYFMELLCQGQTVAIDMLHARHTITHTSDIWEELYTQRCHFYTKNLEAFVGYAQRQAAKYGIRGSRIKAIKDALNVLMDNYDFVIKDKWFELCSCSEEHIKEIEPTPQGIRQVRICGKVFQETCHASYVIPILRKYRDEYGTRAKLAEQNEGVDWKAVSHAIRAAFELRSIYQVGDIYFPLAEAELLKIIKSGICDYKKVVAPLLEETIEYVKELAEKSSYPEKVNRVLWYNWIVEKIMSYYELYK